METSDSRNEQMRLFRLKARVAKALAHESRLLILDALKRKDRCVSDLSALLEAEQSTISKHLLLLKNAGIVSDRREGNKIFYHLETPCVLDFFTCALEVIQKHARAIRLAE